MPKRKKTIEQLEMSMTGNKQKVKKMDPFRTARRNKYQKQKHGTTFDAVTRADSANRRKKVIKKKKK